METEKPDFEGAACPLPLSHRGQVVMGHGSGGQMSHDLITRLFLPRFDNPALRAGDDSAVVEVGGLRFAISTDSHVVMPLFFPGGDIGRLSVCGTVNDVAVMGARPLFLSAGFILEEGFDLAVLDQVLASMQAAAAEAGVQIITGDTKVVQRGKADGLYINTTGIGLLEPEIDIRGSRAAPGDVVILSGLIGDHGIAVLAARGELGFETDVCSDVAPLNHLVSTLLEHAAQAGGSSPIHVLRDPTRGGVATTLNEIAQQSQAGILLFEEQIPVRPSVSAACEMLGFDPLYVANEGKLVVIVREDFARQALETLRSNPYGRDAVVVGKVMASPTGRVLMKTVLGTTRMVDVLAGEMLPRIC